MKAVILQEALRIEEPQYQFMMQSKGDIRELHLQPQETMEQR
ncbi:hypothetical protein SDC9_145432 [bioreactor metagenome]|uniref:Uncharacterized protein n=1 Tax=bioreactor metagenome TaxID=1076179 RepID=A0A645E8M3_9ZZZZ